MSHPLAGMQLDWDLLYENLTFLHQREVIKSGTRLLYLCQHGTEIYDKFFSDSTQNFYDDSEFMAKYAPIAWNLFYPSPQMKSLPRAVQAEWLNSECVLLHNDLHLISGGLLLTPYYGALFTESLCIVRDWWSNTFDRMQAVRAQQLNESKINVQQLIEENISETKVIDNFATDVEPVVVHHAEIIEVYRQDDTQVVPVRNIIGVIRPEIIEVNHINIIEENPNQNATEDYINIEQHAQVLFTVPDPSSFTDGGTTSLISSSSLSPPKSGGTSTILPQASIAQQVGEPPPIPPSPLDTTPRYRTSKSGGTATGASTADNPDTVSIFEHRLRMQILHPRTGIGVQVSSPPPTASFCSTGVYAIASSASPANVADNPDNPDLAFDPSGTVPDNPCKPASDLWAYVASRG